MEPIKFYPKDAAMNPDCVLEQAVGHFESVIVIGYDKNEMMDVRASLNLKKSEILWLISKFQHKLLNGDYDAN